MEMRSVGGRAFIVGCAGLRLTAKERAFFRDAGAAAHGTAAGPP